MPSRKRPTPEVAQMRPPPATPLMQQPSLQYQPAVDASLLPAGSYSSWGAGPAISDGMPSYPDAATYGQNAYGPGVSGNVSRGDLAILPAAVTNVSNQLIRRNQNQQIATVNRGFNTSEWDGSTNTLPVAGVGPHLTDAQLDAQALNVRRTAESSRKQIPPFIQKLQRFLSMGEDQSHKSIRWSDDGESFMIVNEEVFSSICLPTVFKHNNYASFVRQLNMYGFHKVVGLGDNSKSSSESGAKAPSVYQHAYFKRDRPHLLWLISKPKTSSSQPKRKKEDGKARSGDGVSDDDLARDATAGDNIPHQAFQPGKMDDMVNDDIVEIPRAELVTMRNEISNLLQQQNIISASIMHLRRQNEQLYNQVASAQNLHDRHENSINAILTFLASIYNQSLENHAGQNRAFFPGTMPPPPQQSGTVVDVGDVGEATPNSNESPRAVRRPIALLPAPLATTMEGLGSPIGDAPAPREAGAHTATVPSLTDVGTVHGSQSDASSDSQPQRNAAVIHATGQNTSRATDIISMINNVNAQNSATPTESDFDFSAALNHFQTANGNSPLSSQERSDVLHRLTTTGSDAGDVAGGPILNDINNAFLSSMTSPIPSLDTFTASRNQLDHLQRLQQEQASKVQRLVDRVQSHSPTGVIPGLGDANGGIEDTNAAATPASDSTDTHSLSSLGYDELTNFLESADFPITEDAVPQTTQAEQYGLGFNLENQDVLDLDFGVHPTPTTEVYGGTVGFDAGPHAFEGRGFAGGHAAVAGRIVESLSSEATSPAATVADEIGGGNEHESVASAPPSKKRRVA